MLCPKCQSEFESLMVDDIEIDRCTTCGGVWLDALEREVLERNRTAGNIDVGDARVGRAHDAMRRTRCPRCDVLMSRVADRVQFHVEFELCPACHGSYFDAGELKDLTRLTIIERFRSLANVWLAVR